MLLPDREGQLSCCCRTVRGNSIVFFANGDMLLLLPVPPQPVEDENEPWVEYPVPGAAAAKTEAKAEAKAEEKTEEKAEEAKEAVA
jgi:hypothetical protein